MTPYSLYVFIVGVGITGLFIGGLTIPLYATSPKARYIPPTFTSTQSSTTSISSSTLVTSTPSTTTTTTTATTTTIPPTFPALSLTCPSDTVLLLGESFAATGSPVPGGGCTNLTVTPPIIARQGANLLVGSFLPGTFQVQDFAGSTVMSIDAATRQVRLSDSSQNVLSVATLFDCGVATYVGGTLSGMWDGANWVFVEARTNNTICLYVNNSAYAFPLAGTPLIGNWPRLYAITNGTHLCTVDKATIATLFCAPSLSGGSSWAPMHGQDQTTEMEGASSGTRGAVFVRVIDDELTAMPSINDQIEIDHWTHVTNSSRQTLRYKMSVHDFDWSGSPFELLSPTNMVLNSGKGQWGRVRTRRGYAFAALRGTAGSDWYQLRWESPAPLTNPLWRVRQQGRLSGPTWGAAVEQDDKATLVIAYMNLTDYPSLYVVHKLDNDVNLRSSTVLALGDLGSMIGSNMTSPCSLVSPEPNVYIVEGGPISSNITPLGNTRTYRVQVDVEQIFKTWLGYDTCGNVINCTQTCLAI